MRTIIGAVLTAIVLNAIAHELISAIAFIRKCLLERACARIAPADRPLWREKWEAELGHVSELPLWSLVRAARISIYSHVIARPALRQALIQAKARFLLGTAHLLLSAVRPPSA